MIYIYKITNLKNNKKYIGQTINSIYFRFAQHLREHRGNNELHKDMQKQNKKDFKVTLIDTAFNNIEADEKERFWIKFHKTNNPELGYNLDSGGKSNCTKSESALEEMRNAVIRSWNDKDKSEKMLEGLRKGTETWKRICEENKIDFECPICGEILKLSKHEIKTRKTCGKISCKNEYLKLTKGYTKGLNKANEVSKIKYKNRSDDIRNYVINWSLDNKEIVLKCPKNKITTVLQELINNIDDLFGVKDLRSIAKSCCGTQSKIEFLKWLQNEIK